MSKIIQEAKNQKDLYGHGNVQETYYAVCNKYLMLVIHY